MNRPVSIELLQWVPALGPVLTANTGVWIGAKVGLLANPSERCAEIDWFEMIVNLESSKC
jgi:hypothetical protein